MVFKPVPPNPLPYKPWPGNAAENTAYWGVWLGGWQVWFRNIGIANQREAREAQKEEAGIEKHRGKFLQETVQCNSIPSGRPEVSPYRYRKRIFQKQLLVFRWTDDRKKEGRRRRGGRIPWKTGQRKRTGKKWNAPLRVPVVILMAQGLTKPYFALTLQLPPLDWTTLWLPARRSVEEEACLLHVGDKLDIVLRVWVLWMTVFHLCSVPVNILVKPYKLKNTKDEHQFGYNNKAENKA